MASPYKSYQSKLKCVLISTAWVEVEILTTVAPFTNWRVLPQFRFTRLLSAEVGLKRSIYGEEDPEFYAHCLSFVVHSVLEPRVSLPRSHVASGYAPTKPASHLHTTHKTRTCTYLAPWFRLRCARTTFFFPPLAVRELRKPLIATLVRKIKDWDPRILSLEPIYKEVRTTEMCFKSHAAASVSSEVRAVYGSATCARTPQPVGGRRYFFSLRWRPFRPENGNTERLLQCFRCRHYGMRPVTWALDSENWELENLASNNGNVA